MNENSNAKELAQYSFLVVFANDDAISQDELKMLERIALQDGVVDDQERKVLQGIFARANIDQADQTTLNDIAAFRDKYGI